MSLIEIKNWPSRVGAHKRSKEGPSLEQRILADNDFKRKMAKTLRLTFDNFKDAVFDRKPCISFDAGSVAPKGEKLSPQEDRVLYILVLGLMDRRNKVDLTHLADKLACQSCRLLPKDWGVKVCIPYPQNPDLMAGKEPKVYLR